MTTPIICRPPSFPIRRILACPTEGRRRRMAGRDHGPYYGPTVTCLGCGDAWSCGEMLERPFRPRWRKEAIAAAKRAWTEAGRHTRAEYEQWLAAELAAVAADYGSAAEDVRAVSRRAPHPDPSGCCRTDDRTPMTTTPPTDQQLDEIEARTNAATPGPWQGRAELASHIVCTAPKDGTYSVLWNAEWATEADATFTAHAREDVPALLAYVRRLRTTLTDLAGRWDHMADQGDTAIGQFEGPAAATLDAEVGERGRTYRKAAADVRDVLRTGQVPHDLMTSAERDAASAAGGAR